MRPARALGERDSLNTSGICAEERLILQAARGAVTGQARGTIQSLVREKLDWMYILTVATRHAVAPILHYGLEQALGEDFDDALPAAAHAELGRLRTASSERSAHIRAEVDAIAEHLAEAGIETLGLKDLTLGQEIYPEPGLRPIGDVDLLVRRDDYQSAARLLEDLDFTPVKDGERRFEAKYSVGRHLRRPADELWVDLQWNVAQREWDLYGDGRFTYDVERMWRRARRLEKILAPSDEDMLFHLCLHAEGHSFGELILLCDIAELLRTRSETLEWSEVLDLAAAHGTESSLYYTLRLVSALLAVDAPVQIMEELEPDYFQASLFVPLFSNLGPLHESLDDIERAARPPAPVADAFESAARAQASMAMRLAAELDGLAREFGARGGELIVLSGWPSPRIFPDATTEPFGRIEAFVLDRDAELIDGALSSCGFLRSSIEAPLEKECELVSSDPAVPAGDRSMLVCAELLNGLDELAPPPTRGKSQIARETIAAHLRAGAGGGDSRPKAQLSVRMLSAEEMVAACAWRAANTPDKLFGLCTLLQAAEPLSGELDWRLLAQTADRLGVSGEVSESLARLSAVSSVRVEEGSLTRRSAVRLFEWARYGPNEMQRHGDLRDPFFFLLALGRSSARGKAGLVLRALARDPRDRASLLNLAFQAARGALRAPSAARSGPLDTVYWIDRTARPESR